MTSIDRTPAVGRIGNFMLVLASDMVFDYGPLRIMFPRGFLQVAALLNQAPYVVVPFTRALGSEYFSLVAGRCPAG